MFQSTVISRPGCYGFLAKNCGNVLHGASSFDICTPCSFQEEFDGDRPISVYLWTYMGLLPYRIFKIGFGIARIWNLESHHLPEKDGKRVGGVAGLVVVLLHGDLGGHVAWAASHSTHVPGTIRISRRVRKLLGETKVKDLDIISLRSKKIKARSVS
jgi:hypothetical protein